MAFQLKQLVPCLLLLLWIMSFSYASDQLDQRSNHTLDDAGFAFHLVDKDSGSGRAVALNFVRNLSDSDANNTLVLSTIDQRIELWRSLHPGLKAEEASFRVTVVYQPLRNQSRGGLAFLVLPFRTLAELELHGPLDLYNRTFGRANISGTSVSVVIGVATIDPRSSMAPENPLLRAMVVNITADPGAAAASSYAMWINYDRAGQLLSVYVDVDGNPKPTIAIAKAHLSVSSVAHRRVYFGVLSTVAQVLRSGVRWNTMIEDLPAVHYLDDDGGFLSRKVTIVYSVLSSVAATTLAAGAVLCYINSRYRMWRRDLDQLVKYMERLPGPGVPTKVDFAVIKKATRNFHETMKLGGGGFGTVYRCTLPANASKTDQPMDVAIKRFNHDVQNRRYDDFLAEVSIINRLHHKNIVPLVGWSYHKGEPLLVFEYMSNGSLDQHIFSKEGGSSSTSKPRTGSISTILPWATRYEIVNNIATGLHYVHHEYEPMVLHRDIKASNIMLDSSFRARLGDFGIACTVADNRNSVTGIAGTWGYIAPEYAMCRKATRQTDIYALGVLMLEVVTGQRALADHQVMDDDDIHISDRMWRLHCEGRLLECVDAAAASEDEEEQVDAHEDVARLLLLGLACSNPNPSDRPTMPEVVQVITKSMPPPEVPPQMPRFVWPPPEGWASDHNSMGMSIMSDLSRSTDEHKVSLGQPMAQAHTFGGYASLQVQSAQERATGHASFRQQHSV